MVAVIPGVRCLCSKFLLAGAPQYAATVIGGQRSSKHEKRKKKAMSRAASYVGPTYEDESDSASESQSYLAIGSGDPSDEQLKRVLAGLLNGPQASTSGAAGSFTLPTKNKTTGDLMKTFMACQNCSEISTQSKQLQCSHTICMKCAMALRTKHLDPGN